jgi:hypothetical protein
VSDAGVVGWTVGLFWAAVVLAFPEVSSSVRRFVRRTAEWPSRGFDGLHIGSGYAGSKLFVVFDPPWWRIGRWIWWARTIRGGATTGVVPIYVEGATHEVRVFEKPRPRMIDPRRRRAG